ncbi:hypothetical protein JKP88DRAFT_167835, partial [Tribonema minus]
VFGVDMLVQFNTAVALEDGRVLAARPAIAANYLKTWFVVDFVSTVPWELMFGNERRAQLLMLLKLLRFGR